VIFPLSDYTRKDFEKAVELHGYKIKGNLY